MGLLREVGWRTQPQNPAPIAKNSISQGLVLLVPGGPNDGFRDLKTGIRGTPTGLTTRRNSQFGNYAQFGTSNYLDLTLPAGISGTTPITIAFTYRQTAQTDSYPVVLAWKPTGAANQFLITIGPTASYYFCCGPRDGASSGSEFGAAPPPLNVDRACVLTLSSGTDSTSTSSRRLWINGVNQPFLSGTSFGADAGAGFRLGKNYTLSSYFEGSIGNFHIWNRVLTDSEASAWTVNPFMTRAPRQRLWPGLGSSGTDLILADTTHAHPTDGVVLTLNSVLALQETLHSHVLDSASLTSQSALVLQETLHSHALDSTSLTLQSYLTVADALHAHNLDALTLTVQSVLTTADALHSHTADNIGLTQNVALTMVDTLHSQVLDAANVTTAAILAPVDVLHGHAADNVVLNASITLSLTDTVHNHNAELVTLLAGITLLPADTLHTHTSDTVTLTAATSLALADALHGHTADVTVLSTALSLLLADATHTQLVDSTSLQSGSTLVPARIVHSHTVDTSPLTIAAFLAIVDALHTHRTDTLTLLLPDLLISDRVSGVRLVGSIISLTATPNSVGITLTGRVIRGILGD